MGTTRFILPPTPHPSTPELPSQALKIHFYETLLHGITSKPILSEIRSAVSFSDSQPPFVKNTVGTSVCCSICSASLAPGIGFRPRISTPSMSNRTPKDCTAAFGDGLGVGLSQRKRTLENRSVLHNLGAKDFKTRTLREATQDIVPQLLQIFKNIASS